MEPTTNNPNSTNSASSSAGGQKPARRFYRPNRGQSRPQAGGGQPYSGQKSSGGGNRRPPRRTANGPHESEENRVVRVPDIDPGIIRIIPLGGVEEIGKNMTAIEFEDTIIVVDAGLEFPGEDAPGVDYIIPDTTYLEQRKHKVKAMIVTHGHLDHIGGIPYVMEKIGNPIIYTTLFTAVMIKKRQEEFPQAPKLNIQVLEKDEHQKIGPLSISFFAATHTIPDSMGIVVETPFGNIIVTGDIKIEHKNGIPEPDEVKTFSKLSEGNNLCLIADSTNVWKAGFSFAEKEVHENVGKIIKEMKGRMFIGTFASLLERIIYVVKVAEELGKKVVVEGRSMRNNIDIARELGILKVHKETIIPAEEMDGYPDNKLIILATGAQGDEYAALMRLATKEHRQIKIKKGDTVVLSSSVVPGNEDAVQKLKDNLARLGAKIIHHGTANVHSSGHSYEGEVEWVHKMIKPRFVIPVHGHHYMLRVHQDLAIKLGVPEKNIAVPDNGSVIEISEQGHQISIRKEKAVNRIVMVDGLGSGNVKEVVIRDRQLLSQDGMFVIIAAVDANGGKVRKSPDIISRGFIYLKESQDILRHVRGLTKKTIEHATAGQHPINFDYVKNNIREEIGKYLYQKTHRRPIVIPVIIEV